MADQTLQKLQNIENNLADLQQDIDYLKTLTVQPEGGFTAEEAAAIKAVIERIDNAATNLAGQTVAPGQEPDEPVEPETPETEV